VIEILTYIYVCIHIFSFHNSYNLVEMTNDETEYEIQEIRFFDEESELVFWFFHF
jgi:hypothetical protein